MVCIIELHIDALRFKDMIDLSS